MGLASTDMGCMSVHSVKRPTARKSYHCSECRGVISPGEVYRRDFMIWEGEAEEVISCATCDELTQKFFKAIPKEYRHEITFHVGDLKTAIIELRDEFGVWVEGFEYPAAELIPLNP